MTVGDLTSMLFEAEGAAACERSGRAAVVNTAKRFNAEQADVWRALERRHRLWPF